jgi:hypothetical protein
MSSSKTLASILGSEEADALECWLSNKEPPDTLTGWIEENSYRGTEVSRHSALQGAVGALLLRDVQGTLPRTAVLFPESNVLDISRGEPRPQRKSNVSVVGQHLFTINWADEAPGMNWLTSYNAVWVPVRNVWVVIASDDSGEMHGYLDVALGWFKATAAWEKSVARIVTKSWKAWASDRQPCWQELCAGGRLSLDSIVRCRQQAWPKRTQLAEDY